MAFAACALTVAACSGGSSGGTTPYTPPSTGPTTPTGTTSSPVSASSGGSVTTTTSTGGSLSVTVPANGLSSNATVTIYSYTSAASLPKSPFSRTASTARHRGAVPSGATFLAGFAVDTGTAIVMSPLKVSETIASVPTGDVVRVARFNGTDWNDVDTGTASGTTATNDVNKKYVSVSGGGTSSPYIFYAVPSASANAPAAITASASSKSSLVIGSSADFTVSAADANGNPLPFTPGALDTDNHALATAKAGSTPFDVVLTAANQGGTVNIVVTDSRTGTYDAPVSILTQRPANAGNTFTFSGTLTQSDVYAYPTPNPLPSDSKTASVTQTVTVSATSAPSFIAGAAGTVQDFSTVEKDAFPLQTLTTTTDAYFQTGSATNNVSPFLLLGSSSTDDEGNTSQVAYAAPGVTVDELPESAGQKWSNSPAMTLTENFVDSEQLQNTVNADGSYNATENIYSAPIPSPSPGSPTQQYPNTTINSSAVVDGSATLSFLYQEPTANAPAGKQYEADFALSAPGSNGIQMMGRQYSYWLGTTPPPWTDRQAIPLWYSIDPNHPSLYSESDTNLGSASIPSSCNVPSSFGSTGTQLEQNTSTLDPAAGTLETVKTDEYVVTGSGPVCVQVSDTLKEYYDYNGDYYPNSNTTVEWPAIFNNEPLRITTVSETLGLQTAITSAQARRTNSVAASAIPNGIISLARMHVQHLLRKDTAQRRVQAAHHLFSVLSAHKGVSSK